MGAFAGQVADVDVIPGSVVRRGQPAVTVQMMDPIKVEVEVAAATARRLNERGYLVFAGVRRVEQGERLVEAAPNPDRLLPLPLDVTDAEAIESARASVAATLRDRQSTLHALANNAADENLGPVELLSLYTSVIASR